MNDLKICAAYVRVSSDGQIEYSPDSQIKLIREFAKRENYYLPDEFIFRDDGISGRSADKRPAFKLMIATAKQSPPPFSTIFVWKYSRFARNQEESIVYRNLLKRNGVTVKSISEPSMEDSPFSGLIESVISWMDEFYILNLSGEVKRGMKEKSSRGEFGGKPPFGYDVKDKILVQNENAKYVKYVFDAYISGKSFREIGRALGDAGVKINGDVPGAQAIKYILRNPAYIGMIRWTDEEHASYRSNDYTVDFDTLTPGKHEAIISVEDFQKAQERLAKRSDVRYAREGHPVMMLKGLLRCDNCGGTLVDVTGRGKTRKPRLQCCRYSQGKCKVSHYISEEDANAAVIDGLEQVIAANTFVFAPKQAQEPTLQRDWDKLITQEETRLKRAKSALLDGAFSNAEYKEVKASVEETIARLKAEKAKDAAPVVDAESFAPQVKEVIAVLRAPDVSGEAKNMALRSIVDKIVFNKHAGTFDIFFKSV